MRNVHALGDIICQLRLKTNVCHERFRRDGLVSRATTSSGADNIVEEVTGYAIASVFTPEWNRGKGFAKHMMSLLHWVIGRRGFLGIDQFPAEWGSPPERPSFVEDGEFSVLYSDVGPRFYQLTGPTTENADGWQVTDPTSTIWNVRSAHALLLSHDTRSQDWRWLDKDTINEAWKVDAQAMMHELSITPASNSIAFAFLPTRGVAEFQHHRLEQFWSKMEPTPIYWGISSGASADAAPDVSTFASWTLDFRPPVMNRLIVTRLRTPPEMFESLLFQIIDFAKRHSVDEVEVWNLPSRLRDVAQRSEGKTFNRDDHLPSFKWYGSGNSSHVSWAYNEK